MKKFIAMLLALAMVLAFAACAKTEQPAETTAAPETTAAVETTVAVETEAAETADVMTYAEYAAIEVAEGDLVPVVVECYVQATQSWWDNSIVVYAADAEGAYFIYGMACSEEDSAKLVPGTKIRVSGDKVVWSGEYEIMNGTFEFVEDGETYVAEALDVTELLGTDELIDHQNEFVAFNGMTVEAIEYKNGEPGDDIYVTLGYNGASYSFCVEVYLTGTDSDVYTTVGELEVGDVVNVEGYLYWYEGVNPHITAISVAE